VRTGEYEFAIPHFFEEMANDDLLFADVERVIATGSGEGFDAISGAFAMR
jgi:hypothetical protein